MARTEIGFDVMKRAIAELAGMGHADSEPRLIGRNINVMLTALPANKLKLKFHDEPPPPPSDTKGKDDHDGDDAADSEEQDD